MAVREYVKESVFSKASGHSYKHESFAINDSHGVYAGVCFR